MLLMTIPAYDVMATSSTQTENFEGGVAGTQLSLAQSHSGMFNTYRPKGDCNVTAVQKRSGLKSYYVGTGSSTGEWNFSYSKTNYLTNMTFYSYVASTYPTNYFYFFNSTHYPMSYSNVTGSKCIVYLRYTSGQIHYYDDTGTPVLIGTLNAGAWEYTRFNVQDNLGDVNYKTSTSSWHVGVARNPSQIANNYRIDRCFIVGTLASEYFDDLNFTLSDSYAGSAISGCTDFSGDIPIGSFGYGSFVVKDTHVSTRYNIPVTTTVKGVEIQIMPDQYAIADDASTYTCSINGVSIGHPVCFFNESYYVVVQWTCNIAVTDTTLNFDFENTQYYATVQQGTQHQYWDVGCGISDTNDLNGDNEVGFYYQDNSVVYHWTYIFGIPFFVPTYGAGTTFLGRDLGMRYWCTGFATSQTYNYPSSLGLAGYSSSNVTGYLYDRSLGYNTIFGSYTLGSKTLSYSLHLYLNGTQIYKYGFPMTCRYPGSGFGFAPDTIGKYRIQMNSTHRIANVTAYVYNYPSIYWIKTNPSVSDQYVQYFVNYSYNQPQGYPGGIAMDYFIEVLNTFTKCVYQRHPIVSNTSSGFAWLSNSTNAELWGLYTDVSSYSLVATAKHIVRLPSVYANEIKTARSSYSASSDTIHNHNLSITISGTHIFPGGNVQVDVNGIFLGYVGDNQYFVVDYRPSKFGVFNASLILTQNGTSVLIATCNFTVTSSDTPTTIPSNEFNWINPIPSEYRLYLGLGFIIFMLFLPFIVVASIQKKVQVQLPISSLVMEIACVITGVLGWIITIIWGLMPWYSVFVVIFVLILVWAILYYSGHKAGGGGGATS
jgi:hypothetical protein